MSAGISEVLAEHPELMTAALAACRARWELVKAVMLGRASTLSDILDEPMSTAHMAGLLGHRDAVFRRLAAMAQTEDAARSASIALYNELRAVDPEREQVDGPGNYGFGWSDALPNAEAGLRAYLDILLEQVRALP